jgi:FdhE protein
VSLPDLRKAWADLLRRRAALAESLAVYGDLVDHWATTPASALMTPLDRRPQDLRESWSLGVPLIEAAAPGLDADTVEESLARMLELAGTVRPDAAPGLKWFAEAWDRGEVTPASLFPARGRIGTLDHALGLDADVGAFLAVGSLRPHLEAYFATGRAHLADHDWALGVCPFCGAPPGFGDVGEDGRRRLACHLCGSGWTFSRLRCPFCGNDETRDLGRIDFEAAPDHGYFISTCARCGGYIKELDRRIRWNGGPALVEDWGSPHFDLAAREAGYWRPAAPLILPPGACG